MDNTIRVTVKRQQIRVTTQAAVVPSDTSSYVWLQLLAGETISALRVVRGDVDGKVYVSDTTDVATATRTVGITMQSAVADATVRVVTEGLLKASGTWTMDKPIFFTSSGQLTQVPPTAGYTQAVGYPINTTDMIVRITQPITLA